jgi:hypothetical protein
MLTRECAMNQKLLKAVHTICRRTDDALWASYRRRTRSPYEPSPRTRLVFPAYHGGREGRLRASEQEARFVFVESMWGSPFLYSVDAPTRMLYKFKSSKERSGQSDLALYDRYERHVLNVEFKCKGLSTEARLREGIARDVQKLLREPGPAMWFHLLKRVSNSSLPKVTAMIREAFADVLDRFAADMEPKLLIFHMCVLDQAFSLHRMLGFEPETADPAALEEFFRIQYRVTRHELRDVADANGWELHLEGEA